VQRQADLLPGNDAWCYLIVFKWGQKANYSCQQRHRHPIIGGDVDSPRFKHQLPVTYFLLMKLDYVEEIYTCQQNAIKTFGYIFYLFMFINDLLNS